MIAQINRKRITKWEFNLNKTYVRTYKDYQWTVYNITSYGDYFTYDLVVISLKTGEEVYRCEEFFAINMMDELHYILHRLKFYFNLDNDSTD